MSTTIVAGVVVAAPAEDVFAAATDWAGQREWIFATTTSATRGDGRASGDEISARTGFGPLGFTDTMTITHWDPPRTCSVRHTGRVVRGTATFEVTPRGPSSSVFTWTEEVVAPLGRIGAAGLAATRGAFAYFLRLSLRRFARWAAGR